MRSRGSSLGRPLMLAALAGLTLAGCANSAQQGESRLFGMRPGPLPSPQPFVVESRAGAPGDYPRVGNTPPPRYDRLLTPEERQAAEDNLKRYQNTSAPPRKYRKPAVPVM